jgi:hypothetical protein
MPQRDLPFVERFSEKQWIQLECIPDPCFGLSEMTFVRSRMSSGPTIEDFVDFAHHTSLKIVKVAVAVVATLIIDACLVRFIEQTHGSFALDRALSETIFSNASGIEQTATIVAFCTCRHLFMILLSLSRCTHSSQRPFRLPLSCCCESVIVLACCGFRSDFMYFSIFWTGQKLPLLLSLDDE